MDDETLTRAFEPLYTTKPEGKGTGLGLASVLSIVEMSGGHVTLSSELGRGTTITLYLPIAESVPRQAALPSGTAPTIDLRGTTVLLAEDSPDVRNVISRSLAHHGCTVLQARDGTDALLQIERAAVIDVLCTDAVMPGAPVREVIALLKRKHPNAGVVVISGYVTDELTRRGIEQGHFRVLAKPFEPYRLLETIDELRRAPAKKQQEPMQFIA
jgi:CheY-like chemotaxis protein